jgi:hypothetical protein
MLAFGLCLTASDAPAAEQAIVLQRNLPDADWHFVMEQFGLEGDARVPALARDAEALFDRIADLVSRGVVPNAGAAIDYIRDGEIATAWLDLTGDGVDEVIVVLGFGTLNCGTAGCDTTILRRGNESWVVVAGLLGVFPESTLCYEREGLRLEATRYPLLRSASDAIWWTGTEFRGVCYRYCQGLSDYKQDTDAFQQSLAAEELILPERLRERSWCAAPP